MTREQIIELIKETVTLNLDEHCSSYEIDLLVDGEIVKTICLDKDIS